MADAAHQWRRVLRISGLTYKIDFSGQWHNPISVAVVNCKKFLLISNTWND
jgi:hypothetical protein